MIPYEKFVDGAVFWYCYAEFSSKTFRFTKKIKPVKVVYSRDPTFPLVSESSNSYGYIKDDDNTVGICIYDKYLYQYYGRYLFDTESEAKEGYNALLLNELDRLQSYYETKKSYLEKNLLS